MNSYRTLRLSLKWLGWIFAAGIVVQVALAGLALFDDAARWADHGAFAEYISVVPVVMLVVSLAARLPKAVRAQCAMLVGMIVLIALSAMFSAEIGRLAALHPVIAVFLFFRTMAVIRLTDSVIKAER